MLYKNKLRKTEYAFQKIKSLKDKNWKEIEKFS